MAESAGGKGRKRIKEGEDVSTVDEINRIQEEKICPLLDEKCELVCVLYQHPEVRIEDGVESVEGGYCLLRMTMVNYLYNSGSKKGE